MNPRYIIIATLKRGKAFQVMQLADGNENGTMPIYRPIARNRATGLETAEEARSVIGGLVERDALNSGIRRGQAAHAGFKAEVAETVRHIDRNDWPYEDMKLLGRNPTDIELYVTTVEQKAYDMAAQLCLPPAQVRCHVSPRSYQDKPFYVVIVDAPEALDRAKAVRDRMLTEWGYIGKSGA